MHGTAKLSFQVARDKSVFSVYFRVLPTVQTRRPALRLTETFLRCVAYNTFSVYSDKKSTTRISKDRYNAVTGSNVLRAGRRFKNASYKRPQRVRPADTDPESRLRTSDGRGARSCRRDAFVIFSPATKRQRGRKERAESRVGEPISRARPPGTRQTRERTAIARRLRPRRVRSVQAYTATGRQPLNRHVLITRVCHRDTRAYTRVRVVIRLASEKSKKKKSSAVPGHLVEEPTYTRGNVRAQSRNGT